MLDQIKQLEIEQIQEIYWVTRELLFEQQQKERSMKKDKKHSVQQKDKK